MHSLLISNNSNIKQQKQVALTNPRDWISIFSFNVRPYTVWDIHAQGDQSSSLVETSGIFGKETIGPHIVHRRILACFAL